MPKLSKIIKKTLSLRLSLIIVCAIALLLMGALSVMFHFSRQSLKEEVISNAEETLKGKAKQIDNILLSVEQSTGNVYWNLIRHLDKPDRMETLCRELVKCNPYVVGCAIAFTPDYFPNREQSMIYVHRKDYLMKLDEDNALVTQYKFDTQPYTKQAWYAEPMKTGKAEWIGPLKNHETEGEALITFSLPIYDHGGKVVGVLAADVSIRYLSEIVHVDKPSKNGYVALLARNGSFIIHPDEDKVLHQTVFTQTEKNTLPSVREAADAMVGGEIGFKPFLLNDKKNHVLFRPFRREAVPGRTTEDLGWSIGVVYPEDEIFKAYNHLLYYLIVISVVGLLLIYYSSRKIVHHELLPLTQLKLSAQRIADGNYSETIPDTKREDEIGQLQTHFQKMQQTLKARMDEEEQLSAQLKERGDVLKTAYRQAQKADQMKMAFLHLMTNQMLKPADAIEWRVTDICNHCDNNVEEIGRMADAVWQQGGVLLEVMDRLIEEAEGSTEGIENNQENVEEGAV